MWVFCSLIEVGRLYQPVLPTELRESASFQIRRASNRLRYSPTVQPLTACNWSHWAADSDQRWVIMLEALRIPRAHTHTPEGLAIEYGTLWCLILYPSLLI